MGEPPPPPPQASLQHILDMYLAHEIEEEKLNMYLPQSVQELEARSQTSTELSFLEQE